MGDSERALSRSVFGYMFAVISRVGTMLVRMFSFVSHTKYHSTWFKQEGEFTALYGLKRLGGHQVKFDEASGSISLLISVLLSSVYVFPS